MSEAVDRMSCIETITTKSAMKDNSGAMRQASEEGALEEVATRVRLKWTAPA